MRWEVRAHSEYVSDVGLDQGSQTRGPREGLMRPANNRKNQDFYEILG